jgi:hypothetical protein
VERKQEQARRVAGPLLSELQVPEWQELAVAVDRRKWRKVLKSIDMVWCYRHENLDCLCRDTALTNRGLRQLTSSAAALPSEDLPPGAGRVLAKAGHC